MDTNAWIATIAVPSAKAIFVKPNDTNRFTSTVVENSVPRKNAVNVASFVSIRPLCCSHLLKDNKILSKSKQDGNKKFTLRQFY